MRLIDADELLKQHGIGLAQKGGSIESYQTLMLYEIRDMIEDAPTVSANPVVHAMWIRPVPGDGYDHCSNCKVEPPWFHPYGYYEPEYCPHCGAKMDLEDNI